MSYFWHIPTTKRPPNWQMNLFICVVAVPAIIGFIAWDAAKWAFAHTRPTCGGAAK